ncbi:MAG: hypothetical protein JNK40_01310 [Chromatiales bacterium]|nr:hypothetical protein [Chromatiales bacterium]
MSIPTPASSWPFTAFPLALALTALAPAASAAAAAAEAAFDPARVGWSEIRMTASKLFLTAEARLTLRTIPGATVVPDLLDVPAGQFTALTPGTDVLEVLYDARGAGRVSRLTLLMDPRSGAALQRTQHDQQGKQRLRTYRFGIEGAYQRTFWPANAGEKSLMPARWTRTTEGLRAYPIPPGAQPVVEPTGLLYAVAAAPLDKPGDTQDVLVFRRHDTQVVRIEVLPPREISVQYDELWPRGAVQRSGKVQPLRLSLQGLPVPGGDPEDDDLELLGLRGRLELLLDPATRAPLQLSGNVKIVGSVTLRLSALRPR